MWYNNHTKTIVTIFNYWICAFMEVVCEISRLSIYWWEWGKIKEGLESLQRKQEYEGSVYKIAKWTIWLYTFYAKDWWWWECFDWMKRDWFSKEKNYEWVDDQDRKWVGFFIIFSPWICLWEDGDRRVGWWTW